MYIYVCVYVYHPYHLYMIIYVCAAIDRSCSASRDVELLEDSRHSWTYLMILEDHMNNYYSSVTSFNVGT